MIKENNTAQPTTTGYFSTSPHSCLTREICALIQFQSLLILDQESSRGPESTDGGQAIQSFREMRVDWRESNGHETFDLSEKETKELQIGMLGKTS